MLHMNSEEKTNTAEELPDTEESLSSLRDVPAPTLSKVVELMQADLERSPDERPKLVHDPAWDDQLNALSEEELTQQIDLLKEQIELGERQQDLDRRAVKLGLLKLANEAPRCSHLKSNGKPCRAPALGNTRFCVFHGRALNDRNGRPGIEVALLEDRESLQLTVKQIMEQIVSGYLEPQTASLLLRSVQIANSTLKPRRIRVSRRKPSRSEGCEDVQDNPEENIG